MRNIIYRVSFICFFIGNVCFLSAQSTDQNFVKTTEVLEPVSIGVLNSNSSVEKIESVTYLDGLGKPKQSIAIKQSTSQKDIVQHIEYDEFGRAEKQYLPLPTNQNTANYITNAQSQINTYYQNNFNDQHPYTQQSFDNSPLNRVIESSSVGNSWQIIPNSDTDHTNKFVYASNSTNEVYRFDINESDPNNPLILSYYAPTLLLKNTVKNENWVPVDGLLNTKETFTDKNGRKVAEFSYELNGVEIVKLQTYYVYDTIGNLRFIIPPKVFRSNTYINYINSSVQWPINDFLQQGTNGTSQVILSITNNILKLKTGKQSINQISLPRILNPQTTKALNISPQINNLYLGIVYGASDLLGVGSPIGVANIINGNLVVDRTSSEEFNFLSINIEVDLIPLIFNLQTLDDLAFQYRYDQYNRQIEQKVPGKGWEYMVYDQLDRPILTQDANLRVQNKWMFNKYDVFGRVVYSGLYTNSASRTALQTQTDNFINSSSNKSNIESRTPSPVPFGGVNINYSIGAFPNNNAEVLTVNYFDDYNFSDSSLPTIPSTILGQQVTTRTKGLLTASWTKTLNATTWSKNYNFYDEKGRLIFVHDKNYLGGYTENSSKLDFRGKIIQSVTTHKRISTSVALAITDNFTYDHSERPLKHSQKINAQTEQLIAENIYNELGQLQQKKVGGNLQAPSTLQTMDYVYNIKGWLTNINDVNNLGNDLFAYNIKYDTALEGQVWVDPQYTGNITQVIWKSAYNNSPKKGYFFAYDKLNRFSAAYYRENNTLTSGAGKFEAYEVNYDANGNINSLKRNDQSSNLMDRMAYSYDDGNKLLSIEDSAGNTAGFNDGNTSSQDYYYDANGNLVVDKNKNITNITYNHLDLVTYVTFGDGKQLRFYYDANGTKLKMESVIFSPYSITTIDYLGGFQYTNTQLKFFPTPEGYVSVNGSTYSYVYQYKDHLGNNRVSYTDTDNNGIIYASEIVSNTDYYPMGLTHFGDLNGNSDYNYKFQGKEQLAFGGYNMYDFGSRMYDASVGRWFNTDPQNQFNNPYLAMGNIWVVGTDPNGEIFGADDLVAGLFTGIGNVIGQAIAGNIDSWKDGASYFGIGFVAGLTATYTGGLGTAAILSAGNSAYGQYDKTGQVDFGQVATDATIGAVTAGIAAPLGSLIQSQFSGVFSNISSQLAKDVLTQSFSHATTGFVVGTGFSLINGQSLNASLDYGFQSGATGFATGTLSGFRMNTAAYKNKVELTKIRAEIAEKQARQSRIRELAEANAKLQLEKLQAMEPDAHFYSRHGPQTGNSLQQRRAYTGITPDGIQQNQPQNSSRFFSNVDMLNMAMKAQSRYLSTGETKFNIEFTSTTNILGGGYRASTPQLFRYSNTGTFYFRNGYLFTAYPSLSSPYYFNPLN